MSEERAMSTWLIQVANEDKPRAVKSRTGNRARMYVANKVVGEARKATVDDAWRLAEEGVKIEEVGE